MENHLQIVSFGLIGESKNLDKYRHVVFKDTSNGKTADLVVYAKERPELWGDIQKLELGKQIPLYNGYISNFNKLDIIVFENEGLEQAFERQKWRLEVYKKITLEVANQMRLSSTGYVSNLTREKCIEISWGEFDQSIKMVKFRSYQGNGVFKWSKWYEIG